jgi:hypothetical protein
MSELPEGELAGIGVDAPPQGPFLSGDVRRHPEAPGHSYLGQATAEPTSGQHQVPSEDPLFNEIEIDLDDDEAPQLPASSGSQAAPTVTTGGVVAVPLHQVVMPNSDPQLLDESQDIAEDYEEPRPQDVGSSLPPTSRSSSSFNQIFVKHSALEDLISLVDDSLPFTTDSADVSHDAIRLQDPTLQPGTFPGTFPGDRHIPRPSRAREVRHQPRRCPADEPEDRGRMLELRPGPPVSPYTTFSPEISTGGSCSKNEYRFGASSTSKPCCGSSTRGS